MGKKKKNQLLGFSKEQPKNVKIVHPSELERPDGHQSPGKRLRQRPPPSGGNLHMAFLPSWGLMLSFPH